MHSTDQWEIINLDLASDNPAEAKRIRSACTYRETAVAWANSRRKMEGVGYKVEY